MSMFDPQPEFVEHDAFVHALLGLMSINKKFERLIDSAIDPDNKKEKSNAVAVHTCDDEIVLALLGLVALNERLRDVLEDWIKDQLPKVDLERPSIFGFEDIENILR